MNSTPSCTISGLARRVLLSPTLDEKLAPTPDRSILEDDRGTIDPLPTGPTRPPNLEIVGGDRLKVPPASGMIDPAQRTRLLHALANHELQAAELFAWALLAYPDAPSEYRRGLAGILADEQRHTRMYVARLESLGGEFGALPVTGYFWNKAKGLTTPLKFVCAMSLTFENANLDHTTDYVKEARKIGDEKTAALIDRVHEDEIEHVRFGWKWLKRLKLDGESMWEAYCANLTYPLQPNRAIGRRFHESGRVRVGMEAAFIAELRRFTSHGKYPRWD